MKTSCISHYTAALITVSVLIFVLRNKGKEEEVEHREMFHKVKSGNAFNVENFKLFFPYANI